jgi:hypothetical protein
VARDNQDENRITSPTNAPECAGCCLTKMLPQLQQTAKLGSNASTGVRSFIRADVGWPGLTTDGFLVRLKEAVSSSRPNFPEAASAAAVQDGRRPPPQAARSVLDGGEYGVKLGYVGIILMPRIDLRKAFFVL